MESRPKFVENYTSTYSDQLYAASEHNCSVPSDESNIFNIIGMSNTEVERDDKIICSYYDKNNNNLPEHDYMNSYCYVINNSCLTEHESSINLAGLNINNLTDNHNCDPTIIGQRVKIAAVVNEVSINIPVGRKRKCEPSLCQSSKAMSLRRKTIHKVKATLEVYSHANHLYFKTVLVADLNALKNTLIQFACRFVGHFINLPTGRDRWNLFAQQLPNRQQFA